MKSNQFQWSVTKISIFYDSITYKTYQMCKTNGENNNVSFEKELLKGWKQSGYMNLSKQGRGRKWEWNLYREVSGYIIYFFFQAKGENWSICFRLPAPLSILFLTQAGANLRQMQNEFKMYKIPALNRKLVHRPACKS